MTSFYVAWKLRSRRDGPWSALVLEKPKRANLRPMDKNGTFQTYDDFHRCRAVAPRLAALRAELKRRGLDGFVVPRADEHQGEYLPAAERLAWLTGFSGSAGAAVVLTDKAAIFVDGRYTLQVAAQIDTSLFVPRPGGGRPDGWIADNLPKVPSWAMIPGCTPPWRDDLRAAAKRPAARWSRSTAIRSMPSGGTSRPAAPRRPSRMPSTWRAKQSEAKRVDLARTLKKAGAEAAVITLGDSSAGCSTSAATTCRTRPSPWPSPSCTATAAPTCSWTRPSAIPS